MENSNNVQNTNNVGNEVSAEEILKEILEHIELLEETICNILNPVVGIEKFKYEIGEKVSIHRDNHQGVVILRKRRLPVKIGNFSPFEARRLMSATLENLYIIKIDKNSLEFKEITNDIVTIREEEINKIKNKPCPNCGSNDLSFTYTLDNGHGYVGFSDGRIICNNCKTSKGNISGYGTPDQYDEKNAFKEWNK